MRWAHQTQMPYGRVSPFCSTSEPSRTSFTMLCRAGPNHTRPHYKCHGLHECTAEPTDRRLTGGAQASCACYAISLVLHGEYLDQGDALLVQLRGGILPQAGIEAAQQLHALHNGHPDVPRSGAVHAHQVLASTGLRSGPSGTHLRLDPWAWLRASSPRGALAGLHCCCAARAGDSKPCMGSPP